MFYLEIDSILLLWYLFGAFLDNGLFQRGFDGYDLACNLVRYLTDLRRIALFRFPVITKIIPFAPRQHFYIDRSVSVVADDVRPLGLEALKKDARTDACYVEEMDHMLLLHRLERRGL